MQNVDALRIKGQLSAEAQSAFTLAIHGHTSSQARAQSTFTGRVMSHSGGRWAVGIVGLVILGAGLVMAYDGIRRKFVDDLQTAQMDEATQRTVTTLGVVGAVARGLVFALSGFLFVDAAWTYDAKKATGLDGALRTLQQTAFGPYLLAVELASMLLLAALVAAFHLGRPESTPQ